MPSPISIEPLPSTPVNRAIFLLLIDILAGIPGCGGLLTESAGQFSSPSHPETYQHNLDCEWLLRPGAPTDRIKISFLAFDVEYHSGCRFDFVEIREGSTPDSPLVGRFCGHDLPPDYVSEGNTLLVRSEKSS